MNSASPTTTSTTTPLVGGGQGLLQGTPRRSPGSVGPFFAVISVIIVLSALSCVLGRYCGSRAEGPDSWYDCLGWFRRTCGWRHRSRLGCVAGERVTVDFDQKVRDSAQLTLPSPQP